MLMHGFKSFGKRTEVLFGDEFNVVLGPNGSGKSNVLDALCFVLGKSSAKSLRAEKSSNLIYNGGKSKKPAKTGEVSIFFDNATKVFPSEAETVKISRIVKATGQSKYKINDETRTRQQVLDLLSIARINPDGYNIILQGDIVRLVTMSGTERRQIVEEIAGIGLYEEKKHKAVRELEKVGEKLNEAEIILKERKAYLRELRKDRDHALKYKDLTDKITQNKASYLKIQINRRTQQRDSLQKRIDKESAQLEKLNAKIKKYRDDIQTRREKIKEIDAEIERKGEKEQIELQKEVEGLRVKVATNKTRINLCESEIHKAKMRKQQLDKNLEELDHRVGELQTKKKELEKATADRTKQRDEIDKRLAVFRKKHELDQEGGIESDIENLDKEIEGKQHEINTLREEQQDLLREKDKLEFQIQTVDERILKVKELEKVNADEIRALKQKKTEFKNVTGDLNKLLTMDSTLARSISTARSDIHEKSTELSKLEAKNASIQETISGNIAMKKILENKSKFGGVYGSVAELGEVKTKYAIALEIAAGARINGIVVDSDAVAAKCIKFLKDNRLGRASFLPLNKIKGPKKADNLDRLAKNPGVHGLATDLVKFDPKFKEVFRYVFGNTLVVDSIDVARKLGVGVARMVSMDGDLTELSGVMIGGYRAKIRGGAFKDKDLSSGIDKLQTEIGSIQSNMDKWQKDRASNEDKIVKLRELKATLEGEIIKTEKSLHLESSDLDASKAYKKELKDQLKNADKQLRDHNMKISGVNRDLANFKIKKQQLRGRIQELKSPTVLAELNAFEQKRAELSEELIHLAADSKSIDAQMEAIVGRDRESTQRIFKDLNKEVQNFIQEIKTRTAENKEAEKVLKVKEQVQKKFYAKSKELYDKRNKLNDEANSAENLTYKTEEQARQIEYKTNSISLEQAKYKAELAALEADFEQYKGVELNLKKPEDELKRQIRDFEKMKDTIGSVNMKALEIYSQVEGEYNNLLDKAALLHKEKDEVLKLMMEIEGKKKELFLESLETINGNFQGVYKQLSAKGNEAMLVLEDPKSPFDAGMRIVVKTPTNKMLDIRSLSGGEKTMTALAFLFAIQEHEPASFYVLDEVDAALDKKNSDKLAKLIRNYCQKAQYIVISHNDAVISEGDNLYGVSMDGHGISKVVSLKI